jgi:hypothetical protein
MVLAAQTFPPKAHAWSEVAGEVRQRPELREKRISRVETNLNPEKAMSALAGILNFGSGVAPVMNMT